MEQDQKQMTLEQIEQHIQNANLDQYDKPQARGVMAEHDLSDQLQKICGIYRGVRPVLREVSEWTLIPQSIKNALKTFMGVMDSICPEKQ